MEKFNYLKINSVFIVRIKKRAKNAVRLSHVSYNVKYVKPNECWEGSELQ